MKLRTQRNYYEILGVPPTATTADIKRKYRQLARKFHPDVVQDKSFGQRAFIQITEAYKTLSDPIRRREYDQTLGAQRQTASSASSSVGSTRSTSQDGRQAASSGPIDRLVREAEYAFIRGRLTEAANYCKQAIRDGKSSARAHSILGDIYRIKGQTDRAILEYTLARQHHPSNAEVISKLNNLLNRPRPHRHRKAKRRFRDPEGRAAARLAAASFVGWGGVFFLILILAAFPGEPAAFFRIYLPFLTDWSWNLFLAILVDSVLIGLLMSITGMIDHPDDELIFGGEEGIAMGGFPTGLFLLLFSGISFWLGAGIYIFLAYLQETLSRSVLKVFVSTVAIVFTAALVYPHGSRQIVLFAGNLAFIGTVIGWYIGAMTRSLAD